MNSLTKQDWYLILFFNMAIWGTLAPATKYLSDVPQSLLALIRTGFGLVVLVAFLIVTKKTFNIQKKDMIKISLVSLLAGYIPPLFFALGVVKTSSILGSIITNTSPLFIPIFSIFLINQKLTLRRFLFTLMGFFGVIILVMGQGEFKLSLGSNYFAGVMLLVLTALSITLNTIMGQDLVKRYGGTATTTCFMAVGFCALLIHNLITGEIMGIYSISRTDLLLSIYIGVFPTAVTWILFISSLKILSPSEASLFKLLIPVFTAIYSVIFLKESLTLNLLLGAGIVMSSIYLVQKETNLSPDIE